jgi:hypothetical protein
MSWTLQLFHFSLNPGEMEEMILSANGRLTQRIMGQAFRWQLKGLVFLYQRQR